MDLKANISPNYQCKYFFIFISDKYSPECLSEMKMKKIFDFSYSFQQYISEFEFYNISSNCFNCFN